MRTRRTLKGKSVRNQAVEGPRPGAGDNYGLGYKAPIGRMRGDSVGYRPVSKKELASPPRSVV